MYISESIKSEIEYFKKLHDSFSVTLGDRTVPVVDASEDVLYMLLSASLVMDITEDELFEVVCDYVYSNLQIEVN